MNVSDYNENIELYSDYNENISEKEIELITNYLNNILKDNMKVSTIILLNHVKRKAHDFKIKISLNQINQLLCKILEQHI